MRIYNHRYLAQASVPIHCSLISQHSSQENERIRTYGSARGVYIPPISSSIPSCQHLPAVETEGCKCQLAKLRRTNGGRSRFLFRDASANDNKRRPAGVPLSFAFHSSHSAMACQPSQPLTHTDGRDYGSFLPRGCSLRDQQRKAVGGSGDKTGIMHRNVFESLKQP